MSIGKLFDPLPRHIEDALRASIERFGVLMPIVKDQHGRILDGHHRSRLAEELDVGCRVDTVNVASDEEAQEIARTLNADRRQLTEEQRREVAVVLREGGHSYRAIAGALGVSHEQVRQDLAGVNDLTPARVGGLDGKTYPARRSASAAQLGEPQRARRMPQLPESDPRRVLTDAQIEEAQRRAAAGEAQSAIARDFGVKKTTVQEWVGGNQKEWHERRRRLSEANHRRRQQEKDFSHDVEAVAGRLDDLRRFANVYLRRMGTNAHPSKEEREYGERVLVEAISQIENIEEIVAGLILIERFIKLARQVASSPVLHVVSDE